MLWPSDHTTQTMQSGCAPKPGRSRSFSLFCNVFNVAHEDRRNLCAGGASLRLEPIAAVVFAAAADDALRHNPAHGIAGIIRHGVRIREAGQISTLRGRSANLLRIAEQDRRCLLSGYAAIRIKLTSVKGLAAACGCPA